MRLSFTFALLLSACADPSRGDDPQTNPQTDPQDADGDGLIAAEDCDDADPAVGGEELPFDGVDNDCDPSTLDDDGDGDGFGLADDCDDTDPLGWLPHDELEGDLKGDFVDFCPGYWAVSPPSAGSSTSPSAPT